MRRGSTPGGAVGAWMAGLGTGAWGGAGEGVLPRRAGSLRSRSCALGLRSCVAPPPTSPPTCSPVLSTLRADRPRASVRTPSPAPPHALPPRGLRAGKVNPEGAEGMVGPRPSRRPRCGLLRAIGGGRVRPFDRIRARSLVGAEIWLGNIPPCLRPSSHPPIVLRRPPSGRLEGRGDPRRAATPISPAPPPRPAACRAAGGRRVAVAGGRQDATRGFHPHPPRGGRQR